MDVNTFNALKTYSSAQKTLSANTATAEKPKQQDSKFDLGDAAKGVAQTLVKSESAAAAYMTGKADPHAVVEAMASAELAVETAVTLRNRVVEAYQELLRMPI